MDIKTQKRYAEAMQQFINHVETAIEDKISDWKNENPYWEIGGDDDRPAHCPATTNQDARESLTEDFISSGQDVENVDCFFLFEFVVNEIYGFGLHKNNPYREKKEAKSLTAEEKAIAAINVGTANFINELFGSFAK